jgi:glycosyltransferase involved in cell wall biosynthesis
MKIALVHDAIYCRAGGERVLLNFNRAFPKAPIFTAIYDPRNTFTKFHNCNIRTSWLQKIAPNEKKYKQRFFPLGILAMRSLDLTDYNVILMTTTHAAKYVKVFPKALVIAYCFTPFRLAWNPDSYSLYLNARGLKKVILNCVIQILKQIDFHYSQRPNQYIAMTEETSQRIKNCYHFSKEIPIFSPSIDANQYFLSQEIQDYYLIVSRLEKYKRVDLAVKAFNILGKPLKIVGRGTEKAKLIKMAKKNIKFIEGIDDNKLANLYSQCKALIFPQHEDYGLTPLEANASGRPVIAYGKGGVLETMIPYTCNSLKATALLFNEQTVDSLIQAIQKFETLQFDPIFIRKHSEKFDNDIFVSNIKSYVLMSYKKHIQDNFISSF